MLQLIEAPPRSGKSYFACNYLCSFTTFDKLYREYILKDDVLIISNIEGLKIRHWTLNYCLGLLPHEGLSQVDPAKRISFFSLENFENIQKKTGKNHIILCIDEAHELFPAGFKEKSIYEFFAMHGHIGLDVFFMTQGLESMTRMFNPLFEFIVKATPRSRKISRSFGYKYYDKAGNFLYPQTILSKQSVFAAYKSFRKDEFNKPKSAIMMWGVFFTCLLLLGGGLFKYALSGFNQKSINASVLVDKQIKAVNVQPYVANDVPDRIEEKVDLVEGKNEDILEWRVLRLSAWMEMAPGPRGYVINGRVVRDDPNRFRNFDSISNTVEYLGPPLFGDPESARMREGGETEKNKPGVLPG